MKYALVVACVMAAGFVNAQEVEEKKWNLSLEATPQFNINRIEGRSFNQYTVPELQQRVDDPTKINEILTDPNAQSTLSGLDYFPVAARFTVYAERAKDADQQFRHGFTAGLQYYMDNQISQGAAVTEAFPPDPFSEDTTYFQTTFSYTDRVHMLEAVLGYRGSYFLSDRWSVSGGLAIRAGRSLQSELMEYAQIIQVSDEGFPLIGGEIDPISAERPIDARAITTYGAEASLATAFAITDKWSARAEYNRAWMQRSVADAFTSDIQHWTFGMGVAMKI